MDKQECIRCDNLLPVRMAEDSNIGYRDIEKAFYASDKDYSIPGNTVDYEWDTYMKEVYDEEISGWWCIICQHENYQEV